MTPEDGESGVTSRSSTTYIGGQMRTTALILTAVAGLALAGCGGDQKRSTPGPPAPMTFTAPTTTTIANPIEGQAMRCTNHGVSSGAYAPSAGHGVSGAAD